MLFMEGLKLGLMPLGERMGETLPTHQPILVVSLVVFLLGIGVTFAEPAIGALKAAGAIVSAQETPVLFALLNQHSGKLVLVVGMGVGVAAVLGTLRFVYSWSLKPLIFATGAVPPIDRICEDAPGTFPDRRAGVGFWSGDDGGVRQCRLG